LTKKLFLGYVASDESIGDDNVAANGDAAVPAEPVKPTTVAGLLQDPSCPKNFQVDIELQRGVSLKGETPFFTPIFFIKFLHFLNQFFIPKILLFYTKFCHHQYFCFFTPNFEIY